jgi:MinD-like ATPase involved in chromosome partitioning or flagellar assembly
MKVISFYSFKGGTGRTTTAANVATELARLKKNVVIVDLDIDGPGLDIVLGVKKEAGVYIQDYLKDPSEDNFAKVVYDLKSEARYKRLSGSLRFVPANLEVQSPVDASSDMVHTIISNFVHLLAEKCRPKVDYCIIDSQSGYTDLSATVLDVSDHLFVLSRFSRQHIIGTVLYHRLLTHLRTTKNLRLDFDIVISVVAKMTNKAEERLRRDYLAFIKKNTERDVLVEIPDLPSLKWREQVIVGKSMPNSAETVNAFRAIAARCIELG